jgi:hypothetical protein
VVRKRVKGDTWHYKKLCKDIVFSSKLCSWNSTAKESVGRQWTQAWNGHGVEYWHNYIMLNNLHLNVFKYLNYKLKGWLWENQRLEQGCG